MLGRKNGFFLFTCQKFQKFLFGTFDLKISKSGSFSDQELFSPHPKVVVPGSKSSKFPPVKHEKKPAKTGKNRQNLVKPGKTVQNLAKPGKNAAKPVKPVKPGKTRQKPVKSAKFGKTRKKTRQKPANTGQTW